MCRMTVNAACALMAVAGLRARDVMATDAVSVAEHESLAAAWEVLARGGCRFLPVVRRNRVVGVIDDRAIVLARSTKWLDGRPRLVGDASRPVATVSEETPLTELIDQLRAQTAAALVVTDDEGGPVGVVTAELVLGLIDEALRCTAHPSLDTQEA